MVLPRDRNHNLHPQLSESACPMVAAGHGRALEPDRQVSLAARRALLTGYKGADATAAAVSDRRQGSQGQGAGV
eukprot:768166-Hanusia_phi.AAC.5